MRLDDIISARHHCISVGGVEGAATRLVVLLNLANEPNL